MLGNDIFFRASGVNRSAQQLQRFLYRATRDSILPGRIPYPVLPSGKQFDHPVIADSLGIVFFARLDQEKTVMQQYDSDMNLLQEQVINLPHDVDRTATLGNFIVATPIPRDNRHLMSLINVRTGDVTPIIHNREPAPLQSLYPLSLLPSGELLYGEDLFWDNGAFLRKYDLETNELTVELRINDLFPGTIRRSTEFFAYEPWGDGRHLILGNTNLSDFGGETLFAVVVRDEDFTPVDSTTALRPGPVARPLAVYPNPAGRQLYPSEPSLLGSGAAYEVRDVLGRPLLRGRLTGRAIPTGELPTGTYWLTLRHGGQRWGTKFVRR